MPPRSAKRKAPARSKKSKQSKPQSDDFTVDETPIELLSPVVEENAHIKSEEAEFPVQELEFPSQPEVEALDYSSVAVEGGAVYENPIELLPPLEENANIKLEDAEVQVQELGFPTNESEIELPPPLEENANIKLEEAEVQVQELGFPPQPVVEAVDYSSVPVEGSIGAIEGVNEAVGAKEKATAADTVMEDGDVGAKEATAADTVMEDGADANTVEMENIDKGSMEEKKNDNSIPEGDLVKDFDNENEETKDMEVGGEQNSAEAVPSDESQPPLNPGIDLIKNDNSIPEGDLVKDFDNENEETKDMEVGGEHNSAEAVPSDESQPPLNPEIISAEVETAAAEINCNSNNILVSKEDFTGEGQGEECDDHNANNEDSEQDNEDYEDPSLFGDTSLTGLKKDKNFEIYIGRLDKGTVEDDLIKIFGKFGELKSTRIVRNPTTKKSKGYAFIQFSSADHAKNALNELKDGVKVKGKHVKISASQENDTIHVGNICKTWSKEDVLRKLKEYGVGDFEEIHLPDDPKNDGKIKGFALLEFSTHANAMAAFNRLRKPDAIFGRDKSAKVAFTQSPMHPSEEVLSQVKRVYFEGLTKAWDEEKLKEVCSQYGEILKIHVCHTPGKKHKDFGFVTFTSREGALACVEGINRANIREGEVQVKASMAKPQHNGRLQKQGFRGGFKAENQSQVTPSKKESGTAKKAESKPNGPAKSKQAKGKSRASGEPKGKAISISSNVEQGIARKTQDSTGGQKIGATSKSERKNPKRKKPTNVEDRIVGGSEHPHSNRPSKKPRGNERGKERNNTRNRNRDPRIRQGQNYGAESTKHRNPYATAYAKSPAYQVGNTHAASGSVLRRHHTDMEPHAGYLEPVAVKEGPPHSGYIEIGSGTQLQPHAGYLEPSAGRQGQLHTIYREHTVWTQPSSGYIQNAVRTHAGPHAGYLQPVVAQQGQTSYDPGPRRDGGYDGQGISGYVYGGVGSTVPASYIPTHTRYAGGQVGGNNYQNIGAYPPRTFY